MRDSGAGQTWTDGGAEDRERHNESTVAYWRPLRGHGLRFVLVDHLMANADREVTVAEMVEVVAEEGFELPGRASKVISDALRWEIGKGRVVRLGRGRYRFRSTSDATVRRIRLFALRCRTWLQHYASGDPVPPLGPLPLSPDRRRTLMLPGFPPWTKLTWLWIC